MSKLVVEMEMPKNCPCELSAEVFDPFGNYGGHQPCFAWYGIPARSKEFDRCVVRSERPSWCPIKGVLPEKHGDLIDRDIMYKEIELWKSTATDTITLCFLYHIEKLLMCIRPAIAAERKDDEHHGS